MKLDQEWLNKFQTLATIISLLATPIIVAVVGWNVQSSISNESIKKDYVQIAIEILKSPEKQKDDEMRKWAVAVLDKNSPIPFSKDLRNNLEKGAQRIYAPFMSPPDLLMAPPLLIEPPKGRSFGDTTLALVETVGRCRENSLKLELLQKWNREMSGIYGK